MKMSMYNKDSKFDIDLSYGEIKEKELALILMDEKIEVKSERGQWQETGNIAVELSSRGKPSGLVTTKANWWVTTLNEGDKVKGIIMLPIADMKKHTKAIVKSGRGKVVMGGDDDTSEIALIQITDLMEEIQNDKNK